MIRFLWCGSAPTFAFVRLFSFVCLKEIYAMLEAEICYVDCSHKYKVNHGVGEGGRRPLVEDNLQWKTPFGGRQPSVEDNI